MKEGLYLVTSTSLSMFDLVSPCRSMESNAKSVYSIQFCLHYIYLITETG